MKLLLIYTPQNGEYLKTMLDAMVALLDTATFKSAMEIIIPLAVCMVAYQYIMQRKLETLHRYIITSFIVTFCLLGLRVPVGIVDMQASTGASTSLTVDNVPIGVALPAAIISGLGFGITQVFSEVFHMPDDLDYNKTGMIFGARTWLAATNTRLSMSPDLALDMSSYIRQCIFAAKLLASHQISPQELVNSPDLRKTYFENPSPVYRVILQDGSNLGCREAASNLQTRLPIAAQLELARLGHLMKGDSSTFGSSLAAAHDYYMKISADAGNIITQNILINATRDAAADAFAFVGADAELMNYTNTDTMQKMHVAEANSFWLASYRLPYYMTVMWMLTICIFPLIILLAFFPLTQNIYVFYLQSQAYLWSWPPMFIIIHYFVSLASSSTINIFGQKTGGVTFSNIDSLASLHSNFAYTAGALAASVPFLAYYITKGLSSVLSNAAQHFGGIAQSLSVSEAQSAAQGNLSMASYSGWNMNYDNTNAHKFDTNYHHVEGRSTVQMSNGALLSHNADGSRVGNVQPAISNAAVSVHGSDRVVDSLHQSANESFSHASQLRTAADSHLHAGLSEMKNFTEHDANDYRSGEGLSNTTTASIGQDLRIMKDAVRHHNDHTDNGHQESFETALRGSLNSSHSFPGKILKLFTGGSVEGSATGRGSVSHHHSKQEFLNSSDGKAFNDAYHHMIATAKNSHLDGADSHNLSGVEQIAANFAKGESLMKQASAEYSHGHQLQEAASHATENAKTIDDNLNQAYHDWVVTKYGAQGEQVMLKTDSQSIATQHQWADEFLNSGVGQSVIDSQVKTALSHTKSEMKHDYNVDAAGINASKNIQGQYKQHTGSVDKTAQVAGLIPMSSEQLASAQAIQVEHRLRPVVTEGGNIENDVAHAIKTTEIKNKEK